MARETLQEILERMGRRPNTPRMQAFDKRMEAIGHVCMNWLAHTYDEGSDEAKCRVEVMRYIPIALVASIESWLKLAVSDMVDAKPEFASNSKNLAIKWEHSLVLSLADKRLTIGELISHFVSCSSLPAFFSSLDKLSGVNFHALLNSQQIDAETFAAVDDVVMKLLTQCFENRHIVAHEMADLSITYDDVDMMHAATKLFIMMSDQVVESLIAV